MEHYIEAPEFTRVTVLVSRGFSAWTAKDGIRQALVGPLQADLRKLSCVVPLGHDGIIIETDADAAVEVLDRHIEDPRESVDPVPYAVALERAPMTVRDHVVNQIARYLAQARGEEPETVEEANDFDTGDDDEPEWVAEARYMVSELLEEAEAAREVDAEPPEAETESEDESDQAK